MRIVHFDVDDLHNPWGGGQARRTYEVSRRLATWFGWDVTVVTGHYPGAIPREVDVPRGRLRYIRAGAGPFPINFLSFVASMPLIVRIIDHDLVIEDFTSPVGPSALPRFATRPVVGSAQFLFASEMARKYRLPFNRIATALLPGYRSLITLTNHSKALLAPLAPLASVTHIPQGLNRGSFVDQDLIVGGGDCVLYMGRLDRDQKGIDILINAWVVMPRDARPPLIIAGDGRDRLALTREVEMRGLGQSISFAGRVDGMSKASLLKQARIIVMPSRYETYGLVAIEAMAHGIPLVASNLPELREVADGGALLVPTADPHLLAKAVAHLWDAKEYRVLLGRTGRSRVEGLTWDLAASMQAAVYVRAMHAH